MKPKGLNVHPKVLVPGLQAVKESGVHLRIHRLANLATVLATLQKERVPHLEKIVADEVLQASLPSFYTENHIFIAQGGSWSSWINSGFTLGNGGLAQINQTTAMHHLTLYCIALSRIALMLFPLR